MSIPEEYKVVPIERREAEPWLLKKHYARRMPTIQYAFGLEEESEIVGVCIFGNPPTKWMNNGGIIFNDYSVDVLELNRLVVNDKLPRNTLTFFVTSCLQFLPKPVCIVSYADPNADHHGYIYQALGWTYTGGSDTPWTWFDPNGGKHHDRSIRGPKGFTRGKFSEKRLLEQGWTRTKDKPKHRYIKFLGDKRQVREMTKHLKLPVLPYPKGANQRYDASYKPKQHNRFFV